MTPPRRTNRPTAELPAPGTTEGCVCAQGPEYEGHFAWCDVHGLPSVAYTQGYNEGRRNADAIWSMRVDGAARLCRTVQGTDELALKHLARRILDLLEESEAILPEGL